MASPLHQLSANHWASAGIRFLLQASFARSPRRDVWAYVDLADHVSPAPFSASAADHASDRREPCSKWYCRIFAASVGLTVPDCGSIVRTTSPRQTTSAAAKPAISGGNTRLISSCALGAIDSSAWKSIPERLMFSVVPSRQPLSPTRLYFSGKRRSKRVARNGEDILLRVRASGAV